VQRCLEDVVEATAEAAGSPVDGMEESAVGGGESREEDAAVATPLGRGAGTGAFVDTPACGGKFEPVSWQYTMTLAGTGVAFSGLTIGTVPDQPVFSTGATRMVLSDPIWHGTYIRE
jgi:hypothetical protein